jgi:putative oxidoreductase
MIFHISRGEANVIGVNVIILALAIFTAWGRFKKAPIPAKGTTAKSTFSTAQV